MPTVPRLTGARLTTLALRTAPALALTPPATQRAASGAGWAWFCRRGGGPVARRLPMTAPLAPCGQVVPPAKLPCLKPSSCRNPMARGRPWPIYRCGCCRAKSSACSASKAPASAPAWRCCAGWWPQTPVRCCLFGVTIQGSVIGFVGIAAAFARLTASFGLLIAALGKSPEATRGLAILATLGGGRARRHDLSRPGSAGSAGADSGDAGLLGRVDCAGNLAL